MPPYRQKYKLMGHTIDPNGESVEPDCCDVTFVNYGTNTLLINNFLRVPAPLAAGQFNFFTVQGNVGELDKSVYNLSFTGVGSSDGIVLWRVYND